MCVYMGKQNSFDLKWQHIGIMATIGLKGDE